MTAISCGEQLSVRALPGVPIVTPGGDLAELVRAGLGRAELTLQDGDVLVVASKIVSRAEGRFVDLATVTPGSRAVALAERTGKDARLVELILGEAAEVSRAAPSALIVRHRRGFVCADAGIDFSNAAPPGDLAGEGPWALLLPEDPDASAAKLCGALLETSGARIGVIVSDSHGRPFRLGSMGTAIGLSGLPPVWDRRGDHDLFGRELDHTATALADQLATAADLVMGQADEGRAVVHVRGLSFPQSREPATAICRPRDHDLYAPPVAEREESG